MWLLSLEKLQDLGMMIICIMNLGIPWDTQDQTKQRYVVYLTDILCLLGHQNWQAREIILWLIPQGLIYHSFHRDVIKMSLLW